MSGERLALWWVDRYTRGLPDTVRADRRAELASDVWEQRSASGSSRVMQLAILSRCARGIPADLSWRRVQRRGGRRLPSGASVIRGLGWALAALAFTLLVLVHGVVATPLVGLELNGDTLDSAEVQLYARICGTLLACLVGGALLLRRMPRAGAALVVAGALGTPLAFWWGAVFYGPVGIAVSVAAVILARRRRRAICAATATG